MKDMKCVDIAMQPTITTISALSENNSCNFYQFGDAVPEVASVNTTTIVNNDSFDFGGQKFWNDNSVTINSEYNSLSITGSNTIYPNSYIFGDLLTITNDAFYVRGKKLEQNESEARLVFEAAKEYFTKH